MAQLIPVEGELIHADEVGLDELYHYGVKGMKWGKRKIKYESRRKKTKRLNAELATMDDKQLQDRLNRLRNEEAYRQLNGVKPRNNPIRESVRNKTNEAVASTLTQPVKMALTAGMTYATKVAIDSYRNRKVSDL